MAAKNKRERVKYAQESTVVEGYEGLAFVTTDPNTVEAFNACRGKMKRRLEDSGKVHAVIGRTVDGERRVYIARTEKDAEGIPASTRDGGESADTILDSIFG